MKKTFILQVKHLFSLFTLSVLTGLGSLAIAQPTISSITPVSGLPVSGTVVITGTGFNDTATRNVVWFGGVKATVNTATATSLLVTVPVGAQHATISVLNLTTRLTAVSADIFSPDYDNSCFIGGTNTFKPRMDFAIDGTPNSDPYHSAIGDIDGDGKPDLVVCTYEAFAAGQGYMYIYRNIGAQGQLAFAPPVLCTTSNGGRVVKLGDLDGDGKLDIIVASSGSGRISCMRNKSVPGTISIAPPFHKAFSTGPIDIAVADFDGDGKLDIAGAIYQSNTIEIYRNIITAIPSGGTGAFTTSGTMTSFYVPFTAGNIPISVSASDVDGDNMPDLVVSNFSDGTISVLRNVSMADTFMFEPNVDYVAGAGASQVKVMDINGDNKPEILVANNTSNTFTIFQNNVTTTPLNAASFNTGITIGTGAGSGPAGIDFGDFDGDGKTDIAVTNNSTNDIAIFKNAYAGGAINTSSFIAATNYSTGAGSGPLGIFVGDIDGDMKADIVTGNTGNNTISVFKNTSTPDTNSIRGIDSVCVASTVTLATQRCVAGNAYWSVTTGNASVVGGIGAADSNAVVTGVTAGADTIVAAIVSLYDTNYVRYPIRILTIADTGMISGPADVCVAATISLSETVTGGTWSSSNTAIATVDATGVVTGVGAGSATIFYTTSSPSCGPLSASHIVTVNALPDAGIISGPNGVCTSSSITLTASVPGGTWVNQYPALALAVPSGTSNVLTGLLVGADTVLYIVNTALCGSDTAIHPVGVVSTGISLPIAGADSVCSGDVITLTNGATGGTWVSSNSAIASVNATTGAVTGVSATLATATITYTVTYSCGPIVSYHDVTVKAIPNAGAITGLDSVCSGATISLANATGVGGTWSSSATGIATVSGTGVVTGVSASLATATISYTSATFSCGTQYATHPVTVKALPNAGAITGADSVCSGATIALANATGAPGTWSSLSSAIASVNATGTVTGVSASLATTTISYTTSTFSCGSASAVHAVTVNPLPNAGTITGLDSVCSGATISLANATGVGGTWSSLSSAIASVSPTGVVTGISASLATTTISYTASTFSCGTQSAVHAVTVKPLPNAGAITGLDSVCSGATIALANATAGPGTWSSLSSAIASVSPTGVVTGISASLATTTISYTASTFSCGSASVGHAVTVNPLPNAGAITGLDSVCSGATIALANATGVGGVWSSLSSAIASVSPTGVVTGVSASLATTTISYTSSTFSCGTQSAVHAVTVKPLPNAGAITGLDSVCSGATIVLANATAGPGTWSSLSSAIASVSPTGVVTGISASLATTTISYTASTFSCGSASVGHAVTVKPLPNAGTITGPTSVCAGSTIVLSDAAPGGVWSSASTSIATVTATGVVGGASATLATTNISYTVSTFSCGSASATYAVTVNPLPNAGTISGASSVCEGSLITLSSTATGGTWSSTNTAAATISTVGVAGGVAAGTTTISYTVTNVCGTSAATWPLTVNPLPVAGTISGITTVCEASTTILTSSATGGTWASENTSIATVAGGTVGGVAAGTVSISYTVTNICGTAFDTALITVNPLPHAGAISGASAVCEGSTTSLTNIGASGVGVWSSSNTAIATITTTGDVGGVAAGSVIISYAYTNSCGTDYATFPFTVNPLPHAGTISGGTNLCPGTTTALSSTTPGGVWTSGTTSIATITGGGVAGGVSPGSVTITYTYTNICGVDVSTYALTVIPYPVAGTITGPTLVCPGTTISLSSTSPGGAWSSLNTGVATVTTPGGIVGGVAPGSTTIRYTVTNFCGSAFTTHAITVNPIVVPSVTITLSPNDTVCDGTAITFTPTAVNGGPTPTFIWTNFGSPVATGSTYTYLPSNFDYISCILVSSAPCPVPGSDTSAGFSIVVNPVETPLITIVSTVAGDVISYLGQTVGFFATTSFGGTNPTYQWFLNGVAVSGATSSSFSTDIYSDDTVYCVMTSDLDCITSPTDTSEIHIITIGTLDVDDYATHINSINMFPNPNNGAFTITGRVDNTSNTPVLFQVVDMMGKIVYTDRGDAATGTFTQDMHIGSISPGNYMLRIVKDNDVKVLHFTINN